MKTYRKAQTAQSGAAMVIVMCIMALALVLCLSLLLNASVMMQATLNQKNRQQARILCETLSDQVNEELTHFHSNLYSQVGTALTTGAWPDYQKDTAGHTLKDTRRTYRVSAEDMPPQMQNALSECALEMYWVQEKPTEGAGTFTRILFVTVSCTYKGQTSSLTQSYTATTASAASPISNWSNTGRGTAIEGSAAE